MVHYTCMCIYMYIYARPVSCKNISTSLFPQLVFCFFNYRLYICITHLHTLHFELYFLVYSDVLYLDIIRRWIDLKLNLAVIRRRIVLNAGLQSQYYCVICMLVMTLSPSNMHTCTYMCTPRIHCIDMHTDMHTYMIKWERDVHVYQSKSMLNT